MKEELLMEMAGGLTSTPFYFVRYGGKPWEDAVPALVKWKDWRVEEVIGEDGKGTGRFTVQYGEREKKAGWVACQGGQGEEAWWSVY